MTSLFENLLIPNLRELSITEELVGGLNEFPVPRSHAPFISLLFQPPCHLKALCLRCPFISEAALIECFQLASCLTQFYIEDCTGPMRGWATPACGEPFLGDETLRLLTVTPGGSGCLCPNLKNILLSRCSAFSEEVLLGCINSRWHSVPEGVARLQYALICFSRSVQADIMPQIQLLCEQGLELTVRHSQY